MTGNSVDVSCVVLVDKPVGPTSFDVVRKARRGVRGRVGHAGTLDPFASGLLLVMVGHATRISSLLMELPKQYEASVQFGAVSNTGDPTGVIVPTGARLKSGQADEALDGLRGLIKQRVPLTSAVKVDGEPLYRRAHRGEPADTPQRQVMVYDLSLQDFDEESQTARLLVVVGKGTYVRTLVEDLGSAIGVGAYAAALRRTRIGAFEVDQALQPQELNAQRYASGGRGVFKLDEALDFLPRHELEEREARLAANGNKLSDAPIGRFRVYGPAGLIGIYEGRAGGARPLVIFSRPV